MIQALSLDRKCPVPARESASRCCSALATRRGFRLGHRLKRYRLGQIYKNRPPGTLPMMTLRQIRHFIEIAETGSISAAAQTAFISQSTLTLAIQQLEQEIGVNLFNRHAKGMTLTHQGHQFLRQAHLILATVDNAKRSLQQSTDQVAGQLIIGVTSLVAGY